MAGLYKDGEAAVEYIHQRSDINPNKLFIFGRSLGGAVAIYLAAASSCRHLISGVILENTFTSIPEIAKFLFNFKFIRSLPECCYKNKVRFSSSFWFMNFSSNPPFSVQVHQKDEQCSAAGVVHVRSCRYSRSTADDASLTRSKFPFCCFESNIVSTPVFVISAMFK